MSKEMLELAGRLEQQAKLRCLGLDTQELLQQAAAALRASAVAEPVGLSDDALFNIATEAWSTQTDTSWSTDGLQAAIAAVLDAVAHPAPAAPVPASVREALKLELASYDSIISAAKSDEALSDTGRRRIIECATDAKGAVKQFARHLASLPAPEAAPTREGRHPVESLWRECGLPEYFLGNDGSNTKLYALYDAILALKAAPAK